MESNTGPIPGTKAQHNRARGAAGSIDCPLDQCAAWYTGATSRRIKGVEPMSRRTLVITIGIMLSLFMASMESTVVATAMPTIVSQLGGLSSYSWVFSVYMLASTTTVPVYGKLSDVYGRKPIYAIAMLLFLIGSLLCGF